MLREKRATRGLRMADLVGEAADADQAFWGHETWAEGQGSDEESFSEEEIKPDEFDSDFNDTESESDSEDDSEEEKQRGKDKRDKAKVNAAASKYKEPGAPVRPKIALLVPSEGEDSVGEITPKAKRTKNSVTGPIDTSPRSVRESTKTKTDVGESERNRQAAESELKRKLRGPVALVVKPVFTQKELLSDALETEELNLAWLSGQKFTDDRRAESEKPAKKARSEGCIRRLSRRGTYDTITFTNTDTMPSVFNLPVPEPSARHRCVITGQPAKYFDPLTQQAYANAEAFAALRKSHKIAVSAR